MSDPPDKQDRAPGEMTPEERAEFEGRISDLGDRLGKVRASGTPESARRSRCRDARARHGLRHAHGGGAGRGRDRRRRHRLGAGLGAGQQALAVPAVLRVGVCRRRPQRGEGLRADAEGFTASDRAATSGTGCRTTTIETTDRGSDVAAPTGGTGTRAECPIPSISSRSMRLVPIKIVRLGRLLHQLLAVHGAGGAADRRLLHRRHARRARWCRPGCSRSPRSPTSSSPTCCATASARRA